MMTKSIHLPLAPAEAFELFTTRVSDWWPPENRHTNDPQSTLHLLEDGQFFERAKNGREVELGKVLVWDAPIGSCWTSTSPPVLPNQRKSRSGSMPMTSERA